MVRRWNGAVVLVLVLALAAIFASGGSAAKSSLKPPKSGTWKLIAAERIPGGLKVNGGVVGGFTVAGGTSVKGFHLTFTEEGESVGCAGGESFEGKGEDKKATIKFGPGGTAPIVKSTTGYLVGVANSSGEVQAAEVPIKLSTGVTDEGLFSILMVPRKKKEARSGAIVWRGGECSVAFVVKPG
jgi:hypothetical protein